jgi:hypothetical protein
MVEINLIDDHIPRRRSMTVATWTMAFVALSAALLGLGITIYDLIKWGLD